MHPTNTDTLSPRAAYAYVLGDGPTAPSRAPIRALWRESYAALRELSRRFTPTVGIRGGFLPLWERLDWATGFLDATDPRREEIRRALTLTFSEAEFLSALRNAAPRGEDKV